MRLHTCWQTTGWNAQEESQQELLRCSILCGDVLLPSLVSTDETMWTRSMIMTESEVRPKFPSFQKLTYRAGERLFS